MKRIVVALSVAALLGCGTAQKAADVAADTPGKEEQSKDGLSDQRGDGARAATGAVGGAAAGAVMCLAIAPAGLPLGGVGLIGSVLASLACLPFGVAAGALSGGAVAAANTSPAQTSRQTVTTPRAAKKSGVTWGAPYLTQGAFVLATSGQLALGEELPSGSLYVAMNTIAVSGDTGKRASLIVDLDAPTKEGEKSLIAQTVFFCDKGEASILRSSTYAERFGHGRVVNSVEHAPPIVVEKPSPVLWSAVRTVCDAAPSLNTPAHLYGH